MLLFILACQGTKSDLDSGTEDEFREEQVGANDCFSNPFSEPFLIYATPYDDDGNQANFWHIQQNSGERVDFVMGRAISGQVQISQDGSWGAVAQEDGTLGIFRFQNGEVSVLESGFTVDVGGESIYASNLWLDSQKGELWITDPNWPDNGGGLFRATLDCVSGDITSVEKVFSSKNGYAVHPFGDNLIYLAREMNDQPYQLSVLDDTGSILAQGNAFDDDESIFSALASDGRNILVADNNEFSSIPTRVSHVVWDGEILASIHTVEIEDPVGIAIVDDWAFIASGYGNAVWQYQLSTKNLSSVMDIPLPSSIMRHGNAVYVAGNVQIYKMESSSDGASLTEEVLGLSGVGGIIGAFGVFGEF